MSQTNDNAKLGCFNKNAFFSYLIKGEDIERKIVGCGSHWGRIDLDLKSICPIIVQHQEIALEVSVDQVLVAVCKHI